MWCGNLPLGHRFPLTSAHIGNSEQHISIGHVGDIFWDSVLKGVVSVFHHGRKEVNALHYKNERSVPIVCQIFDT